MCFLFPTSYFFEVQYREYCARCLQHYLLLIEARIKYDVASACIGNWDFFSKIFFSARRRMCKENINVGE
jgi:hypothetical protein